MALEDEIREMEGKPRTAPASLPAYQTNPNYFRLLYNLAAQHMHLAIERKRGDEADAAVVESHEAVSLLRAQGATVVAQYEKIEAEKGWFKPGLEPRLERLLKFLKTTVLPCAAVLEAGIYIFRDDVGRAEATVAPVRDAAPGTLSYRVLYNLACYEAGRGGRSKTVQPRSNNPLYGPRRRGTGTPEPFEAALYELRSAFRIVHGPRRREIVTWAAKDPSFAVLSRYPAVKNRFDEIVKAYTVPEAEAKEDGETSRTRKPKPPKDAQD